MKTLVERETIERREFQRDFVARGRPLLLTGAIESWPARRRWDFDFFRELGGDTPARVELGEIVNQKHTVIETWGLARYIDHVLQGTGDEDPNKRPYLTMFPVLRAFPQLAGDIPFELWKNRPFVRRSVWIGPAGTYSGIHYDLGDNLLVQLVGRKRIKLYSPSQSPYLYQATKFDRNGRFSAVDGKHVDDARFPLFAQAVPITLELGPGQMLFIPALWWHEVTALDNSISVSSFSFSYRTIMARWLPETIRWWLHCRGLYRQGDCTCHQVA